MNNISKYEDKYPFKFFPEKVFHKDYVMTLLSNAYVDSAKKEYVPTAKTISFSSPDLVTLVKIGRIVELNENYNDLFFPLDYNERIRELADLFEGDYLKVKNQMAKEQMYIGITAEDAILLEQDIQTYFDHNHIFYLDADGPYSSLRFFYEGLAVNPFSEQYEGMFFKNIPIKRVW